MCKFKTIESLLRECVKLHTYMIESTSAGRKSTTTIIRLPSLEEFCDVMGMTLKKGNRNISIKYRWGEDCNWLNRGRMENG